MDESCSMIGERNATLRKVWVEVLNESLTMAVPSLRCDQTMLMTPPRKKKAHSTTGPDFFFG
jgi:hypothetical protein